MWEEKDLENSKYGHILVKVDNTRSLQGLLWFRDLPRTQMTAVTIENVAVTVAQCLKYQICKIADLEIIMRETLFASFYQFLKSIHSSEHLLNGKLGLLS